MIDVADGADVHVWFVSLEDLPWARNHFISPSFGQKSLTIDSIMSLRLWVLKLAGFAPTAKLRVAPTRPQQSVATGITRKAASDIKSAGVAHMSAWRHEAEQLA